MTKHLKPVNPAYFSNVYEIHKADYVPLHGVVEFTLAVKLSVADTCWFNGYVGMDKKSIYITGVQTFEIENVAVCSAWVAVHKQRLIEDILKAEELGEITL